MNEIEFNLSPRMAWLLSQLCREAFGSTSEPGSSLIESSLKADRETIKVALCESAVQILYRTALDTGVWGEVTDLLRKALIDHQDDTAPLV